MKRSEAAVMFVSVDIIRDSIDHIKSILEKRGNAMVEELKKGSEMAVEIRQEYLLLVRMVSMLNVCSARINDLSDEINDNIDLYPGDFNSNN